MTTKLALRSLCLAAAALLFTGCAIVGGNVHAFGVKLPVHADPFGADGDDGAASPLAPPSFFH
jgi:hypothetical protein